MFDILHYRMSLADWIHYGLVMTGLDLVVTHGDVDVIDEQSSATSTLTDEAAEITASQ